MVIARWKDGSLHVLQMEHAHYGLSLTGVFHKWFSIYKHICFPSLLISCFVFKAAEELSIPAPLKHQCLISAKWQRKDNWHVCTHIN